MQKSAQERFYYLLSSIEASFVYRQPGLQMYLQQIVSLKQLLEFLYVNQSKSETSEDAKPISTWLAEHLGSEVDSIRQELQVSI